MNTLRQTFRNITSNWGGFAFSSALQFFLSPFVVHQLGDAGYGVWVLIGSMCGYLGLMDLGVRGAVTRYVARFHAQGNHAAVNRVTSSALTIFSVTGMLVVTAAALMSFFLPVWFDMPSGYRTTVGLVLLITGMNVAVSLLSGVFGAVVVGLQRFDRLNAIEVVSACGRALVIFLALSHGGELLTLAFVQLAFSVLTGLAYAWMSRRLYPELQVRYGPYSRSDTLMIFSFGIHSFLLQLSGYIVHYTDAMVIGIFLPVGQITFYAIAANLIVSARNIVRGISFTMSPTACALEASGASPAELQKTLLRSTRLATMVILPVVVTFLVRGESFLALWMGAEYAPVSAPVLSVLALTLLFTASTNVAGSFMIGLGRHRVIAPVNLAAALCNVVLSIVLVQRIGLLGVALGTVISELLVSWLFWPWYIRRTLGIPIARFLISSWAKPLLGVAPFALATIAMRMLAPAPNLLVFFFQVAAVLPAAALGYWYASFTPEQRKSLAEILRPQLVRLSQVTAALPAVFWLTRNILSDK